MKPVTRRLLIGGGAVAVIAATAAGREYYLLSSLKGPDPLLNLNRLDAVTPGSGGVRLAESTAYGPDPRQRLDVYLPAGDVTNAPVVVFFYGGGWVKGDRGDHRFVGRALASRGIIAVVPDYRLVSHVTYPDFVADGATAVQWAIANAARLGGDPHRVAVAGHSAGSYIAAMLALNPAFGVADKVNALIGISGGRYTLTPRVRAKLAAAFAKSPGGTPVEPIDFVRAGAPPTLLLTGSVDVVAAPRITYDFAAALRVTGAPVTVKTYPGVEHKDMLAAFAAPYRWNIPVLDDVARFVKAAPPVAP